MGKPVARTEGICMAFPDMLATPSASGTVVLPYPNIAQLSDAENPSADVLAGGKPVITRESAIRRSTGGEAGTAGAPPNGPCTFPQYSQTVKANGHGIVRQFDQTSQNDGNASGSVLAGFPTVLVGD